MTDEQPPRTDTAAKRQRNKIISAGPLMNSTEWLPRPTARLTFGAFIRALGLGDAGARARRTRPINQQILIKVVGLHGKYGSNLNQIAYKLNANTQDALAS